MRAKQILFMSVFLSLVGCQKAEEHSSEHQGRIVKMPEISKEINLPVAMWDKVTGGSFENSVKQAASFNFAPIQIVLEEKSERVLVDPSITFDFPNGGGEIDLAKFVQNSKGTFRVKFAFEGLKTGDDLQVYYVSKGKRRRIDAEIYGSGCKNYFDLKDYVVKVNNKEGIEVNVTRDRHISVLAGHFVFSYKKDKQTFLSQVTFTDSKRADLICDDIRTPPKKEI